MKVFYWSESEYALPERMRSGRLQLGAWASVLARERGVNASASALTKYFSATQQKALIDALIRGERVRIFFALKHRSEGSGYVDIPAAQSGDEDAGEEPAGRQQ